jgi:transposase IS200 family protein
VHVIFSTRERHRKLLAPIQPNLWAYIQGIARNYGIQLLAIGGTEDHVHLVMALPPKLSLAHAIGVSAAPEGAPIVCRSLSLGCRLGLKAVSLFGLALRQMQGA